MRRSLATWLVLACALGGCADGDGGAAAQPSATPSLPVATVLLDNGEESTLVTVEVAETPEQRDRGLSGRASLPNDEGVVFVFFENQDAALTASDTAMPLSVAFFDGDGTIVRIVDAGPCAAACPIDPSGASYMGALAVNRGAFDDWDISEGDHLQLTR
ncbi:MAG TPA: DUF192 domain-containing protein [Actinomycetota bacterium]|nr:DUF192 domain-containing protein [Actinomycetota bacterium]